MKRLIGHDRAECLKFIADHFGEEKQLIQTMEECSELIKECSKTIRKGCRAEGLLEEIGDVAMMTLQIMYLEGISVSEVLEAIDSKISRTIERIQKEEGWDL